jgi:hypothetical protein
LIWIVERHPVRHARTSIVADDRKPRVSSADMTLTSLVAMQRLLKASCGKSADILESP